MDTFENNAYLDVQLLCDNNPCYVFHERFTVDKCALFSAELLQEARAAQKTSDDEMSRCKGG